MTYKFSMLILSFNTIVYRSLVRSLIIFFSYSSKFYTIVGAFFFSLLLQSHYDIRSVSDFSLQPFKKW